MRFTPLLLSLALIGMTGYVEAARPAKTAKKVVRTSGTTHKVRRGETAAKIARDNKLSLDELAALNPKVNLAKLSVGMVLKVKGQVPAAVAARLETEAVAEDTATAVPTLPVTPIPAIPATGPAVLVHLERLIPTSVGGKPLSARSSARALSPLPAEDLRPVFPPASGLEYESQLASSLGFEPVDPAHLDLLWPVETRSISSSWGPRMRTKTVRVVKAKKNRKVRVRYQGSHKGVDLTAPIGSDVYAAEEGRVVFSGKESGYGNLVIIDHGNGVETRYAHHRANFVQVGDIVHRGQKIAEVGMTGRTTGPHLHFEYRLNGDAQNPLPVLNDVEEIPEELVALNQLIGTSK